MRNRDAAQKFLNHLESEVERVRSKVVTREELNRSSASAKPVSDYLERFRTKMISDGGTAKYIRETINMIKELFRACSIIRFSDFEKKRIEEWIAGERELSEGEIKARKAKKIRPATSISRSGRTHRYRPTCVPPSHRLPIQWRSLGRRQRATIPAPR